MSFTYLSCIRKMGKPAHGFVASVGSECHNKKGPEHGTWFWRHLANHYYDFIFECLLEKSSENDGMWSKASALEPVNSCSPCFPWWFLSHLFPELYYVLVHLASFPGPCSVVPSMVVRDQSPNTFKVKKSASGKHCIMGRGPGNNLLVLNSVGLDCLLEFCSLNSGTKCV